MADLFDINIWAVLVAWFIYLLVGAFWYSPAGFAKKWTTYTGIDILTIPQREATRILISVALSSLVQVCALAFILSAVGVGSITEGLLVGGILWLGFTTATTVGVTLYSRRSWKFLWLNSSYFLVVMTIASALLSFWK